MPTGIQSRQGAPQDEWVVTHTETEDVPTISKAAAAGQCHVATAVSISIAAGATAQTPILVELRDGATGAGTVVAQWALAAVAGTSQVVTIQGLAIKGTANTAMTLEFSAATEATVIGTVTLIGYTI